MRMIFRERLSLICSTTNAAETALDASLLRKVLTAAKNNLPESSFTP
jgi:hypothetical protein